MRNTEIVVQGARAHNLKNVDITIPRDKLVVLTGLSGSSGETGALPPKSIPVSFSKSAMVTES